MSIDSEQLRRRYASLTDEELLSIERQDLTQVAQRLFDAEVQRRRFHAGDEEHDLADDAGHTGPFHVSAEDELEDHAGWLENGFPIAVFSGTPAEVSDAADARSALLAAGIPCEITQHQVDPEEEPVALPYQEYRVMVPAGLSMQAASVLDIAIFNTRLEADWKTQLESLSDEELGRLSIDSLCAGLIDRAERLRKIYKAEISRRR